MDQDNTSHDEVIADADLVLRTRSGDAEAFAELWRRHYPSGMSVARSITSSIDPDDLVQESYTRIYQAIIKGGGPNGSFRAYLFTSIRNTAAAWGRARRDHAIDELDTVADPDSTDQAANEALDRSLTAQAFRSLPSRWQEVLWYTEIEQMKPQEAGALLGMKAGAVSQLAFRAREGLREAWIQAHLRSAAEGSDCQWTIEHLGAYSRGNLSTRDRKRLELHLDECARCMIVAAEAKDVSKRLALVLLPLVVGITGSAGYLATLQGAGTPIVAMAAMPSTVTEGAVVVTGGGAAAAGAGAGNTGGAGHAGATGAGASGGSAGTATGGGLLSGVGALVGAASAALVVAGVVVAATIIPGLTASNPAASMLHSGDGDSSISTDVGPDDAMAEDRTLLVEEEDAPEPPPVEAPVTPDPAEDTAPEAPAAPSTPEPPVVTPPAADPEPPTDPEGPTEPEDPTDPEVPTNPENPGPENPTNPENPGPENPTNPENPGPENPTNPTEPQLPTGAPEISGVGVTIRLVDFVTHFSVSLTGAAGATVDALMDGSTGGSGSTVLTAGDADLGYGVIDLRPTLQQICSDATVDFFYTSGTETGQVVSTTLWELFEDASGHAVLEDPIFSIPCTLFPLTDTVGPVTEEPAPEDPGTETPGTQDPGTEGPGTEGPGTDEPATAPDPITDQPVSDEPETEQPPTETAPVTEQEPEATDEAPEATATPEPVAETVPDAPDVAAEEAVAPAL